MSLIFSSVLLIAFLWALTSRRTTVRCLARGAAVVIALAAAAGMVGLFAIGQKAHWTSDGPGMLLIMLGIPVCALVTLFFGMLALTTGASPELPSSASPSFLAQFNKNPTKKPD